MSNQVYHLANIRDLLINGFTDRELRRLCYDVPNFRPVYDSFAQNTGKADIVDHLLEHAERTLQIDTLLALAREQNPARYEHHGPYSHDGSAAALCKQVLDLSGGLTAITSPMALDRDQQYQITFHWAELGRKLSLRGFDLQGADLRAADLAGADLRWACLVEVKLDLADLTGADLRMANLVRASLQEVDLSGADVRGADLHYANLRGVEIDRDTKLDAKWRTVWALLNEGGAGADLGKADLSRADLGGVDLCSAQLAQSNLSGADLHEANLTEAVLYAADLRKATLRQAILRGANLVEADLEGADLRSADLVEAMLGRSKVDASSQLDDKWRLVWRLQTHGATGINLQGADLSEVILRLIDLNKTDLRGANLSRSDLWGADLSESVLVGADLSGAKLMGTNLSGADLSGANLSGANLNGATVSRTIVTEEQLAQAASAELRK